MILHPRVEVCVGVSGFEIRVISVVGHLKINLAVLESRKTVENFGLVLILELGFENIKSAGVKDNPLRIQRFEYLPIDRFLITLKSFTIFANIFVQNVSDFRNVEDGVICRRAFNAVRAVVALAAEIHGCFFGLVNTFANARKIGFRVGNER